MREIRFVFYFSPRILIRRTRVTGRAIQVIGGFLAPFRSRGSITITAQLRDIKRFETNLWLKALKIDLIEQGTGDNSCHDVPTYEDMGFEEFLGALQEGRIIVSDEVDRGKSRDLMREDPPDYVPVFSIVRDTLEGKFPGKYLIDEKGTGAIRVRVAGYGNKDTTVKRRLAVARNLFPNCAAVVRSGSDGYPDYAELMLFTAPNKDHKHIYFTKENKGLMVSFAMIKEEVWQAMVGIKVRDYAKTYTFESKKEKVVEDFQKCRKAHQDRREMEKRDPEAAKLLNRLGLRSFDLDVWFGGMAAMIVVAIVHIRRNTRQANPKKRRYTYMWRCVKCKHQLTENEYGYSNGVCPHCGNSKDSTFVDAYKEIGYWLRKKWHKKEKQNARAH